MNKYCLHCKRLVCRNIGTSLCRSCYETLSVKTKRRCEQCKGKLSISASATGGICRVCYDYNRQHTDKPWQNRATLVQHYIVERLSYARISSHLGCGHSTIVKWCQKFGIPSRPARFMKNGHLISAGIYQVSHNKSVHRSICERIIGRTLDPKEIVHHINGIKDDNRPENLYLFSSNSAHRAYHNRPIPLVSNIVNER